MMKRKDFLKGAGLASLGLVLPKSKAKAERKLPLKVTNDCVLIPSETAGPFPLDLTENETFFRQDITEGQAGVPLQVRLKVLGLENCGPMQNVRVNVWHCTNEGVYSGYNTNNNPGDADATHLRGYQFTDANGEVEFTTIFPGWYNGRICHIHFQVYVSSSYAAVSQLTFPVDTKNAIYTSNATLYPDGTDPMSLANDMVFSDGYDQQMATLEENAGTGGYSSFLEITVQGSGVTGLGYIEQETRKVFELGQNFPNPYLDKTTIPIDLKQAAKVIVELWDLSGRKVAILLDERRGIGLHQIELMPSQLGLAVGNYVYQVVATTEEGTYRWPKMMTALR